MASEVRDSRSKDSAQPQPPAWFREDFDDSGWEQVTVPEWRVFGQRVRPPCNRSVAFLWYRTKFDAEPAGAEQRTFLVFGGVDWEAEVWLNGKLLGSHKGYYEPFRFDVTGLLQENNTLAVRVIAGPKFGEPMAYWALVSRGPGAKINATSATKPNRSAGSPTATCTSAAALAFTARCFWKPPGEAASTEIFARATPETATGDHQRSRPTRPPPKAFEPRRADPAGEFRRPVVSGERDVRSCRGARASR